MRKFLTLFITFVLIKLCAFAVGSDFKNNLLKVDVNKTSETSYDVILYTQAPYNGPIKIIQKSNLNYYILLPETYSSIPVSGSNSDIKSFDVKLYPYAGQDINNGYTKINIITTRPIDFTAVVKYTDGVVATSADLAKLAKLEGRYKAVPETKTTQPTKTQADKTQIQSTTPKTAVAQKSVTPPPVKTQTTAPAKTQAQETSQKVAVKETPKSVVPAKTTKGSKLDVPIKSNIKQPQISQKVDVKKEAPVKTVEVKTQNNKVAEKSVQKTTKTQPKPQKQSPTLDVKPISENEKVAIENTEPLSDIINPEVPKDITPIDLSQVESEQSKENILPIEDLNKADIKIELKDEIIIKAKEIGIVLLDKLKTDRNFQIICGLLLVFFFFVSFVRKQRAIIKKLYEQDANLYLQNQPIQESYSDILMPNVSESYIEDTTESPVVEETNQEESVVEAFDVSQTVSTDDIIDEAELLDEGNTEDEASIEPHVVDSNALVEADIDDIKEPDEENVVVQKPHTQEVQRTPYMDIVNNPIAEPTQQQVPIAEQPIQQPNYQIPRPQQTGTQAPIQQPQMPSDNTQVLSSVEIEPQKGLCVVKYQNRLVLIGYIRDEIFLIHKFGKNEISNAQIKFRLSDSNLDEDFYMVKVDESKFLVKSTPDSMKLELKV